MKKVFTLMAIISTSLVHGQKKYTVEIDTAGYPCSIRSISIVDEKTAWVCGSKGTIGKTENGGKTWKLSKMLDSTKTEFRDIHALDGNTASVLSVKAPAEIIKTSDGGKTWKTTYITSNNDIFLNGMDWFDKSRGIAFGDPVDGHFVILVTTNGGDSWQEVPADKCPPALQGETAFAASGSSLIVTPGGNVWLTSGGTSANVYFSGDFGNTWQRIGTPMASGTSTKGIFSIAMDARKGVIVGGDFTAENSTMDNFAITTDGGKTWTVPEGNVRPGGYRSSVAYTASGLLISTGLNGVDVSEDGGKTWKNVSTKGFHVVKASPKGKWIILAGNDRIGRLTF